MIVKIKNVFPPKEPLRIPDEESDIFKSLCVSLQKDGQLVPVAVKELTGGRYELIDGSHRYRGLLTIGCPDIKVEVKDCPKEDLLRMQLLYNAHRTEVTHTEMGEAVKKIIVETNISLDELATQLRLSREYLQKVMLLSGCNDQKIAKFVNTGKMPIANAIMIQELRHNIREELIPIACEFTPVEFKALVEKIKRKNITDKNLAKSFVCSLVRAKRKFRGFDQMDAELATKNFLARLKERGIVKDVDSAWEEALKWAICQDYYGKESLPEKTKDEFRKKFFKGN